MEDQIIPVDINEAAKGKHPKALYVLVFHRNVGTLCLLFNGRNSISLSD